MPIPHPLPDDLAELVAQRFRVIGEPMRIKLLDQLREGERASATSCEVLGATQQNVSKHLGVLHQAGIVSRRKDGNRVIYAIADDSVFALCETVCGGLARQVAEIAQLLELPAPERSARR